VIRDLWHPETVYLNTASFGLPPDPAFDALQQAQADWRAGRVSWEHWTAVTHRTRAQFATLVGADAARVTVGATISGLVGMVAAGLPEGTRVLAPQADFTSLLFPFLAQEERGVTTTLVPLEEIAEHIDASTDVVALSAVQSKNGIVAKLDDIEAAAREHGVLTIIDATHAIGWLPLDATRFDFVAVAAYKWLLAPRGVAFMTVRRERLADVPPIAAGWYAGEQRWESLYGPALPLAADARRLDVSPAWLSWVGAAPSLEAIERAGIDTIHAHDTGLANRFRAGLGLPPSNSAIVATASPGAAERLKAAGIAAAARSGKFRLSFHLYNTDSDVDLALEALRGG
jgi:selenocysteine lyase/cysteine desulfurase